MKEKNNNTKVAFEEKYFNFLKDKSKKEFRTLKATIEMIVVQYIDGQLNGKEETKPKFHPHFPPNAR